MIKANELRIGNFVYDRAGKRLRIDWFEQDKVCCKQELHGNEVHPMTEYFESLLHIPLNEQWLLKLGFHEHDDGDYIVSNGRKDLIVSFNEEGDCSLLYRENIGFDATMIHSNTEYVHQIQNWYYLIFEQELTMKKE